MKYLRLMVCHGRLCSVGDRQLIGVPMISQILYIVLSSRLVFVCLRPVWKVKKLAASHKNQCQACEYRSIQEHRDYMDVLSSVVMSLLAMG